LHITFFNMQFLSNSKAIAVITTALFVGSLFWLLNTKRVNGTLEEGIQKEKLKSEALLSEKLSLEKEIEKFKNHLFSLKDKNQDLNNLLQTTSAKLDRQEAEYKKMKKENISLNEVKRQRQELIALKSSLENELQSLKHSYQEMEAKNQSLNITIAELQERNKLLTDDLNRAMFAAVDQSQIQAVKKNSNKLTTKARRTKRLIANFEVPADLKNLTYRVSDANGNILSTHDGSVTSTITPSDKGYVASSESNDVTIGSTLQNVEMIFTPSRKLRSGLYTIEVLNDNLHVGSVKVKLN
jgi:hypothetical protein